MARPTPVLVLEEPDAALEVITGLKVQFSLQSYMNLSANDRSSRLAGQL
jgi:hypothetical protein